MASSSSAGKNRSTATKGVVVWEWFNEHGKWRPYSPEVVAFIDKEGQNTSQVCLGNVSAALKMYTIDIKSMCQIRKGTGTTRPVRRMIYPPSSPPAQQVTWEYEGDVSGQWVTYDMELSACLEQAHCSGQQMLDMSALFGLPYSVHFTTMQQVRINTGRTRKIRRSPLQTPYPSAARSPRYFNKLTTVLPDPSLLMVSATGKNPPSTSHPQPSTSAHSGGLPSHPSSSGSHGASGSSGGQKRGRPAPATSSSDTDSDSDVYVGMTLRQRTRQYKKMRKSHHGQGGSGSSGKKSSKGAAASSSATSSAASATLSVPGAGLLSTTPSSATAQSQHGGSGQPAVKLLPHSAPSYLMPSVSLVNAGSTLPLNLITYAQPLGANLTRGFPPMTHLPHSQPHHPLMPPSAAHSQQGSAHVGGSVVSSSAVAASSHSNAPIFSSSSSSSSQGQLLTSYPVSSMTHMPSVSSSHHHHLHSAGPHKVTLTSHLGLTPPHSHSHVSSSSSSVAQVGAYSLLTPHSSAGGGGGSWSMLSGRLLPHAGGMGMGVGVSSPLTMMPSSSQSASLNAMATSQPATLALSMSSSSQGASGLAPSTYQGPLTRKRMQKQMVAGGGMGGSLLMGVGVGGGGGGGVSLQGINSGGHSLMGGLSQHAFVSQPTQQQQGLGVVLPGPGSTNSGAGSGGSGLNLHHHPHHLPPHQQKPPSNHLAPQHLQSLQSHFHHHHHHHHHQQQQQQQQQQQALAGGFGLTPTGYPFNQASFAPTLGHNILSSSALLIPGASSGQHNVPSTGPGGNSLRQPANANLPVTTESLPTETKIVLPKKKKAKTKSKTGEEVLARYMELIPPPENEDCCICYETLCGPSSYGEGKAGQCDVIQLNKCSHMFHRLCLLAMYDSSHKGDSLQCPTCKTIYGEILGNCPPGEMSYDVLDRPLPSHGHCGTIRVTYYISPGMQGPEHPNPGRRFTARGFPRCGFLPDDNRGRKVLKLLMVAFRRKLMFTIGTSATTGETDTVTWNEIHHKTEFGSNLSGHGYPDPNYLDNVTAELALKGVTQEDL